MSFTDRVKFTLSRMPKSLIVADCVMLAVMVYCAVTLLR